MNVTDVNIYEACDKAIRAMNRENVEAFGRLKMSKWGKVNVIKTVVQVYRESAKKAKKRYYGIAFEVYLLGLYMCGTEPKKAHRMADKAITNEWVEDILTQTDFVTLYRFESETERKAYRLAETLEVSENRDRDIDRALKQWSQQLGQYAINFTDYALIQAYDDAGVEMVEWVTQKDERTCRSCSALDGQVFRLDEVPRKPHLGCRCLWKAVFSEKENGEEDHDKA
jgi:SPP1 gp7 family putative phage head morphogenesis protein